MARPFSPKTSEVMEPAHAEPAERLDAELPTRLDRRQRLGAVALGCLLLGLLAVARWLSPNSSGMGTHQQLGLPPCTLDMLFGIRCPTCGMTTSWSYLVRGDMAAAWAANPGGACLAVVSAIAGIWSLIVAAKARYRPWVSSKVGFAIGMAIAAITLIDWLGRVF